MACCTTETAKPAEVAESALNDQLLASRDLGNGLRQSDLSVPGMHCGGCIASIEKMFAALPGVTAARVNLSLKRVSVKWQAAAHPQPDLIAALNKLGYDAHPFSPDEQEQDPEFKRLIRALAVSGFAAMNIMLLSVSVWSGADGATRHTFHLLSAVIAIPAVAFAGQVFFRSAWSALRHGRSNMDVPISVGVLLALALSLYDTAQNAPHAYFDAATSLLFFLLIGRTLDHSMRRKARSTVSGLARLLPRGATVIGADRERSYIALPEIPPGSLLAIAPGERIPIDGVIHAGRSELDRSIVTGESQPVSALPGSDVQAGSLNLTGELQVRTTKDAAHSFVAEMMTSMLTAEENRAGYRSLAERATAYYSPVVHVLAALSFAGWYLASGDLHRSVTIAIAVLIITCPCALGLAVPMVQVAAARQLFKRGILIRDGTALERLAAITQVVFDKTGTLTQGKPSVVDVQASDPQDLELAAALARHSVHPLAKAIVRDTGLAGPELPRFENICEHAGHGLEAQLGGEAYRLGRPNWALETADKRAAAALDETSSVLTRNGDYLAAFTFSDQLRPDALASVQHLRKQKFETVVLSGDNRATVERLAGQLAIEQSASELLPGDKLAYIEGRAAEGVRLLMVGDGLNDAPALAAAHVSMTPATAAEAGRDSADLVFTRPSLLAVPQAISIARRSVALIKQNFYLAVLYNALAIPFAIAGYVTPLVAAVSMSLSSLVVVANSFRFQGLEPASDTTKEQGLQKLEPIVGKQAETVGRSP